MRKKNVKELKSLEKASELYAMQAVEQLKEMQREHDKEWYL
jgi:hypothetical protein